MPGNKSSRSSVSLCVFCVRLEKPGCFCEKSIPEISSTFNKQSWKVSVFYRFSRKFEVLRCCSPHLEPWQMQFQCKWRKINDPVFSCFVFLPVMVTSLVMCWTSKHLENCQWFILLKVWQLKFESNHSRFYYWSHKEVWVKYWLLTLKFRLKQKQSFSLKVYLKCFSCLTCTESQTNTSL